MAGILNFCVCHKCSPFASGIPASNTTSKWRGPTHYWPLAHSRMTTLARFAFAPRPNELPTCWANVVASTNCQPIMTTLGQRLPNVWGQCITTSKWRGANVILTVGSTLAYSRMTMRWLDSHLHRGPMNCQHVGPTSLYPPINNARLYPLWRWPNHQPTFKPRIFHTSSTPSPSPLSSPRVRVLPINCYNIKRLKVCRPRIASKHL
jgi:hypothetical protein